MKTSTLSVLIFGAVGLFLAGCGNDSKTSKAVQAVSNTVNAPVDYLGALEKGKQRAEKVVDVAAINQALLFFHEAEERYPADLDELVAKHYLNEIPKPPYGMKFEYDAASGAVKVVKQ